MKLFNIHVIFLILISCGVPSSLFALPGGPSKILKSYNNRVSQTLYSVGSDQHHAINFICQQAPICYYAPLTYQDSFDESLKKTYFLPRLGYSNSQQRYFNEGFHENLKLLGIDMQIEEIKDKNYGLQVSFTMQPDMMYDIEKFIDKDKKMVGFNIIKKI